MLYCAILSLGILAREPGCFRPMEGPAWNLFIHVLRSFPNLLFMRNSMISAQTLTAMAIFATNHSSWSVEELFITEAARIAVALHLNKQHSNLSNTPERQRLFWVIYCLEKEYCFHSTQSSVRKCHDRYGAIQCTDRSTPRFSTMSTLTAQSLRRLHHLRVVLIGSKFRSTFSGSFPVLTSTCSRPPQGANGGIITRPRFVVLARTSKGGGCQSPKKCDPATPSDHDTWQSHTCYTRPSMSSLFTTFYR